MIWTVIDGDIYDITNYAPKHPGGKKILRGNRKDASEMFHQYHRGVNIEETEVAFLKIGEI